MSAPAHVRCFLPGNVAVPVGRHAGTTSKIGDSLDELFLEQFPKPSLHADQGRLPFWELSPLDAMDGKEKSILRPA